MVESRISFVFCLDKLKERDILEDLVAGGKRILKLMLSGWKGVEWIFLAQDKDHWPSFVDTAFNLRVS